MGRLLRRLRLRAGLLAVPGRGRAAPLPPLPDLRDSITTAPLTVQPEGWGADRWRGRVLPVPEGGRERDATVPLLPPAPGDGRLDGSL